jgi:uncharacterized membrane protein YgcG
MKKRKMLLLLAVLLMLTMPLGVFAADSTAGKDPGTYEIASDGYAYSAPTVADNSLRVYDFADILTDEEEAKATEYLKKAEEVHKCTVLAVTTKNTAEDPDYGDTVTKNYARDFYNANVSGFGTDGMILVIDMNNRIIYAGGVGKYNNEKFTKFSDTVYSDVRSSASDGDYCEVIRIFSDDVCRFDNWVYALIPTPLSLIISSGLAFLVLLILILNHRRAEPTAASRIAVQALNSQQIGHNSVFLGKQTIVHPIPHDTGGSSRGGGFSGGGFSGGSFSGGGGGGMSGGGGHF